MVATTTETERSLPQRMKAFYELVGRDPATAFRSLPELYTDDLEFISPIENASGLARFTEMWETAVKKYKLIEFRDIRVAGDETYFTMSYVMVVRFRIGPEIPTPTANEFFVRGGKVYRQVDIWDTVGALVAVWPPLNRVYMKIVGAVLG